MSNSVHDNESLHRYELNEGDTVAFSVYRRRGNVTTFVHTEVPESLAGHGVGSALIHGALDIERASGRRIVAQCPFVARFIAGHPDYRDLLVSEESKASEHAKLDIRLDEALDESFPASDPLAVTPER